MAKKTVADLRRLYFELETEANDWFVEGKDISRFILPSHGCFDDGDFTNPIRRRRAAAKKVINPVAVDAFAILSSGMHGRLTGQNRHWCRLDPANKSAPKIVKDWIFDCQKKLHTAWNRSNFYEVMPVFYKECAAFGTSSMHLGESDERYFYFDLLTFGEFFFTLDKDGNIDEYFRRFDLTLRQLELAYGLSSLPQRMRDLVKENKYTQQKYRVIQAVYREQRLDKPISSMHFLKDGSKYDIDSNETPLKKSGYYEWPFPTPRWDIVSSYPFGVGLGSDVLPLVKRLQEMEKAFLLATHKAVNPPYNIPARLRGNTSLLPGGHNYTSNVNEKIEPILNGGFEYTGVSAASERVENAIRKMCFNDVFLTGMRDPNASPLKAREVDQREDEAIIRLGPIIGRMYSEALTHIVSRCFNSMLRRGLFEPIDPQLLLATGGLDIVLIGPLAQQQKLIEVRSIQNFFQFLGGIVPFDDTARDKVNVDRAVDEIADMTGAPSTILASPEELQQKREQRQAAMAEQKQKEDMLLQAELQSKQSTAQSTAAKNYASAGVDVNSIMGGM